MSIEYGLSEMMNTQAMGVIVSKLAPSVNKWFPDLPELEADFPAGTIDHSAEPIYPEVSAFQLILYCSIQEQSSTPKPIFGLQVPKWEESIMESRSRYASIIKALADKYPRENLLLVTHGEYAYFISTQAV